MYILKLNFRDTRKTFDGFRKLCKKYFFCLIDKFFRFLYNVIDCVISSYLNGLIIQSLVIPDIRFFL